MSQQKTILLLMLFLISNSSSIANPQQSSEMEIENEASLSVIAEPQKPTPTWAQTQQKPFDVAVNTKLKKPFNRKLFVRRLIRIGVPTAVIAIVLGLCIGAAISPKMRNALYDAVMAAWSLNNIFYAIKNGISLFNQIFRK